MIIMEKEKQKQKTEEQVTVTFDEPKKDSLKELKFNLSLLKSSIN